MKIGFSKKEIKRSRTLGERLRRVREESGLSLEEAEQAIQISKKHLQALEESNYNILPGQVYIEGFLKEYAQFLKVSQDFVIDLYKQERKVISQQDTRDKKQAFHKVPKEIITPKLIRNIIIGVIIVGCLLYLGLEVKRIIAPPFLEISAPSDFITIEDTSVVITGKTEPEATVTINNQEVFLNSEGLFEEEIDLQEGVNIIKISAKKKRSEENTVYRNVLVESGPDQ